MGKITRVVAALLTLGLAVAAPGQSIAQPGYYYWFGVEDEAGRPLVHAGSVRCTPYLVGTGTPAVVHRNAAATETFDPASTHAGQLISDERGVVHFYGGGDYYTYDVKCYAQSGGSGSLTGFTRRGTKRMVMNVSGPLLVSRFPFSICGAGPCASSITLPLGATIQDIQVEIATAVDGAHLNVGLGGPTGTLSNSLIHQLAISTTNVRVLRPHVVLGPAYSGQSQSTAIAHVSGSHRGALLAMVTLGSTGEPGITAVPFAECSGGLFGCHSGSYMERTHVVHQAAGVTPVFETSNVPIGGHVYIYWRPAHFRGVMEIRP